MEHIIQSDVTVDDYLISVDRGYYSEENVIRRLVKKRSHITI